MHVFIKETYIRKLSSDLAKDDNELPKPNKSSAPSCRFEWNNLPLFQ